MTAAGPPASWQTLIEAMLEAVWLVDARTLTVVAQNRRAVALLGADARSVVGQPVAGLASTPEDVCFWDEAAAGTASEIESETLFRHADGSLVPVVRRVSRAELDAAPCYVVAVRDRSAQQHAERALERVAADLRATLESTHDGILVVDLVGRIRNFNHRFAALWDLPEDLLGQRDDDAVLDWMRKSVVDPAHYMRRLAAIDDETLLQASDVLKLQSGRVLERLTVPQCSRGMPIGRVFAFRDIDEKLAASERIEALSCTDASSPSSPSRA